jgi:hypothetical protein
MSFGRPGMPRTLKWRSFVRCERKTNWPRARLCDSVLRLTNVALELSVRFPPVISRKLTWSFYASACSSLNLSALLLDYAPAVQGFSTKSTRIARCQVPSNPTILCSFPGALPQMPLMDIGTYGDSYLTVVSGLAEKLNFAVFLNGGNVD